MTHASTQTKSNKTNQMEDTKRKEVVVSAMRKQ